MRVTEGGSAIVGFAGEGLDVERWREMMSCTAGVALSDGSTVIETDISLDGQYHNQYGPLLPKTKPYDLALRCDTDGHVPQIQFNQDGVWHDFAPEGRTGLKAGPWFPFMMLEEGDRLSDHRVDRLKPTKSAGKTKPTASLGAEEEVAPLPCGPTTEL
jgi:hypothetical protein